MTQFKDTAAFTDLQGIIGNEIAGIFLARLREYGVPDDRLREVSDDICYDIASALNAVGDYEMSDAAPVCAIQEEKTDEVSVPGSTANDMVFVEASADEIDASEKGNNDIYLVEESTDKLDLDVVGSNDLAHMDEKTAEYGKSDMDRDVHLPRSSKGVMSQDEILRVLNSATAASM